jgi:hypothetical protein
MMIKEFLQKIAEKYNARITFPDLHLESYEPQKVVAEITGFPDTFGGKIAKSNLRSDIEELLTSQGYTEFKTISSFNPNKISVEWKE